MLKDSKNFLFSPQIWKQLILFYCSESSPSWVPQTISYFKLLHNLRSKCYQGCFTNTTSEVHGGDLSTNSHSTSKHWRQVLNPDLPNLSCCHFELLPLLMPEHGRKCLCILSSYIWASFRTLVLLCNFYLSLSAYKMRLPRYLSFPSLSCTYPYFFYNPLGLC